VIYDHVHLENSSGSLETTFVALYNQAVSGLAGFSTVTYEDISANLEKQSLAVSGGNVLQLQVTWNGVVWYYVDTGIVGTTVVSPKGGGGLVALTLGDEFYSAPDFGVFYEGPPLFTTPTTFASVVKIT